MNIFEYMPKNRITEMRVLVIGSGSSGNCIYIEHGDEKFLIDAGISRRRVKKALEEIDTGLDELKAIFITHAHGDHVKDLSMILKFNQIPVYATPETITRNKFPRKDIDELRIIKQGESREFGSLTIKAVSSSHDIPGSVVFFISNNRKNVGIVTDLGVVTRKVSDEMKKADLLLLETNYDPDMLSAGPYHPDLKRRIRSSRGHLSNFDAERVLKVIKPSNLHTVLCGHLSQENNAPEIAKKVMQGGLKTFENVNKIRVEVETRSNTSELFVV